MENVESTSAPAESVVTPGAESPGSNVTSEVSSQAPESTDSVSSEDFSQLSLDELELLLTEGEEEDSSKDASQGGPPAETQATGEESAPPPEPMKQDDELERVKRELAAERQKSAQTERQLQLRNTDFGAVKKALREANEKLRADAQRFNEEGNAIAVASAVHQFKDNERKLTEIDQAEAKQTKLADAHRVYTQYVPKEWGITPKHMADMLAEDGLQPEFVAAFERDPFSRVESPETLIQLAHRARVTNVLKQVVPLTKQLLAEKKQWEAERQKLRGQSTSTLLSVSRALKDRGVNGSSGGATPTSKSVPNVPPHQLTDAELEEYLKMNS